MLVRGLRLVLNSKDGGAENCYLQFYLGDMDDTGNQTPRSGGPRRYGYCRSTWVLFISSLECWERIMEEISKDGSVFDSLEV